MNTRIRELLLQATTLRDPPFIRFKVDQEKFAESIVKECMEVVAKKCASPTAYNALAEHFGVTE
jgi:hypothetical protein